MLTPNQFILTGLPKKSGTIVVNKIFGLIKYSDIFSSKPIPCHLAVCGNNFNQGSNSGKDIIKNKILITINTEIFLIYL
jgi:hypothetical protein